MTLNVQRSMAAANGDHQNGQQVDGRYSQPEVYKEP